MTIHALQKLCTLFVDKNAMESFDFTFLSAHQAAQALDGQFILKGTLPDFV